MFQTSSKELFQKYPNPVFIESGSFIGDGIQSAIDAGFEEIYSIEINTMLFLRCVDRFKGNSKVHLLNDESHYVLKDLLSRISKPITFWLDGHNSGVDPETQLLTSFGEVERPVMRELEVIKRHSINTHTILIDDMRLWSIDVNGYDTEMIKNKCLEINPGYKFTFVDGYVKNDILIVNL
jgi:hypothetical protein